MRSSDRIVSSARNPQIRSARAIERDPAARAKERRYVAWGRHLAIEALDAGAPIEVAFVTAALETTDEGRRIAARLRAGAWPIVRTRPRVLDQIADGAGDQGVLLLVALPQRRLEDLCARRPTLLVIAHGVQDPGNLGSIARSALALSAGGLVALEGCADPFGSRVVRAAMGAHFRLPILRATTRESLPALRSAGLKLVAADPAGPDLPIDVDLRRRVALLLGGEGGGLPGSLLEEADRRVRVPMRRDVSSLNVHAAAAILLYEASRQRGFEGGS